MLSLQSFDCCLIERPLLPEVHPSKYPPAEPGALGLEPLKAAGPCYTNPHSYSHCGMPPQDPSALLRNPYLIFW